MGRKHIHFAQGERGVRSGKYFFQNLCTIVIRGFFKDINELY